MAEIDIAVPIKKSPNILLGNRQRRLNGTLVIAMDTLPKAGDNGTTPS
jgi:hypothetical protein